MRGVCARSRHGERARRAYGIAHAVDSDTVRPTVSLLAWRTNDLADRRERAQSAHILRRVGVQTRTLAGLGIDAEMRDKPGCFGIMNKHSVGIYSTEPVAWIKPSPPRPIGGGLDRTR